MNWKRILKTEKKQFEKKGGKPDFLDLDKDGNKTEPMKEAAKDAKMKKSENLERLLDQRSQEAYNMRGQGAMEAMDFYRRVEKKMDLLKKNPENSALKAQLERILNQPYSRNLLRELEV